MRAHDVAVEILDGGAGALQLLADEIGDRRLPGAGEAREPEDEAAHFVWIPHSILSAPVQRPARSSSPTTIGRVQGMQPMDGYPASCSGLYGISFTWMY